MGRLPIGTASLRAYFQDGLDRLLVEKGLPPSATGEDLRLVLPDHSDLVREASFAGSVVNVATDRHPFEGQGLASCAATLPEGYEWIPSAVERWFAFWVERRDDEPVSTLLEWAFSRVESADIDGIEPIGCVGRVEFFLQGLSCPVAREIEDGAIELTWDDQDYWNRSNTDPDDWAPAPDSLLRFYVSDSDRLPSVPTDARRLVDLVMLVTRAPITGSRFLEWDPASSARPSANRALSHASDCWREVMSLERDAAQAIKADWHWWLTWRRASDELDPVLEAFKHGLLARSPELCVTWAIAALEALLTRPEEDVQREAGDARSASRILTVRRASRLCTQDKARRLSVSNGINTAFGLRNSVFHPNEKRKIDQEMDRLARGWGRNPKQVVEQILEVVADVILAFARMSAMGLGRDEVIADLDNRT